MRQSLGAKKVAKYRRLLNLPVFAGLVRGGTNHRVDLFLEDGTIMEYFPKTGELTRSPMVYKKAPAYKEYDDA